MSNKQKEEYIIDNLKNLYPSFLKSIDEAIKLANDDLIVGGFDDNGNQIILDLKDIINKTYLLNLIKIMCIVLNEKEFFDYSYAIELFVRGLDCAEKENYKLYENSLYKPTAMIILSLVDRKIRLFGQQYDPYVKIKTMINNVFEKVIERNVKSNSNTSYGKIKLIAYLYKKIYNMYNTKNLVKVSTNTINRNCTMHNIINNNGVYDVADVNKKDIAFLIPMLFNVCIITETDEEKVKEIFRFVNEL